MKLSMNDLKKHKVAPGSICFWWLGQASYIFKSPNDPPGEAIRSGTGEFLGVHLEHAPPEDKVLGTWHWPERKG